MSSQSTTFLVREYLGFMKRLVDRVSRHAGGHQEKNDIYESRTEVLPRKGYPYLKQVRKGKGTEMRIQNDQRRFDLCVTWQGLRRGFWSPMSDF